MDAIKRLIEAVLEYTITSVDPGYNVTPSELRRAADEARKELEQLDTEREVLRDDELKRLLSDLHRSAERVCRKARYDHYRKGELDGPNGLEEAVDKSRERLAALGVRVHKAEPWRR